MAFLDLKIDATGKGFHFSLENLKTLINALEAVVDGVVKAAKFALHRSGEHVDLFGDRLQLLVEAIEARLAFILLTDILAAYVAGYSTAETQVTADYGNDVGF